MVIATAAFLVPLGSGVRAQTLNEALALAYSNNPTLAAQRARLRATDEQVPQALSGWRPTVRANGEAGRRRLSTDARGAPRQTETLNSRFVGGTIEQPLFRGGRTLAATREAENSVRAERSRLSSVEQGILLDGATAYMDVFRDQSVLELQIRNEQRLVRQLEATRDRFEVGEVTRTDVFQAEARLARATADRIGAEGALERSRAFYLNVIGQAPEQLERPAIAAELPNELVEAVTWASERNPDLAAAEYDEKAALDAVDRVQGELLPEVSLVGVAEREYERVRNEGRTDNLEAFVNVTIPLYQSGSVTSRVRQARQVVSEQRRQLDQVRRDVTEAATQAWNDLQTARAAIESFRKEAEANTVALEGVEQEAAVGARTVLDVLDAEQELVTSQVSLVRAQRDELVAAFQLQTALGQLTARHLDLPVDFYDPERHYDEVRGLWFGLSSGGDSSEDFSATGGAD